MEDREQQPVRKLALVTGAGLILLGLISGSYAYESVKEKDVSRPGTSETATFALG